RYVLAHELGHVLHGHSKAAYLALAACMLLAYISPLAADVVMGLYIGAFLVPNGLGDRAEYQADAVAAKVMGSSLSTIIAQQEVMAVMGGRAHASRLRRWARLRSTKAR
ncbi:MAG: M48 family metalloprotease, partial [Acidobacteriaceae bacterium]